MATAEGKTLTWVEELRRSWDAGVLPAALTAETPVEEVTAVWRGASEDAPQGDTEFRRLWLTALPPMVERQNGTRGW